MPKETLKLSSADYPENAAELMAAALAPGQLDPESWQRDAEVKLAEFLGVDPMDVLLCGSGTAALTIAHHFLGDNGKLPVEAPALTWPSSYCYSPFVRLVDCPASHSPAWSKDLLLRVPVALWGLPVNIGVLEVIRPHGPVVYDCCHAFGKGLEELEDELVDAVVYSFGPTKQVPCVRGGAVVSPHINKWWRAYRDSGTLGRHFLMNRGGNFEIPEPFAALLSAQLDVPKVLREDRYRAALLEAYASAFDGKPLALLTHPNYASGHLCVVLFPNEGARITAMGRLNQANVQYGLHYGLPAWLPLNLFPFAHDLSLRTLSLPCHLHMTQADALRVAETIFPT